MDDTELKRILEALLLVSEKSLQVDSVREVLGPELEPQEIRRLFLDLARDYEQAQRGIRIVEVAEGFQMVTDPALASWVTRLTRRVRTIRLTKPSLETLAIIAYRQPLTRIEIEQVRGVDVGGVLDTLLRLSLIRITGRKETVGRPLLYATTREFLDHFGLRSLEDLPSMEELQGVPAELKEVAGISATESGAEIAQEAAAAPAEEADSPSDPAASPEPAGGDQPAVRPELVEGQREMEG